LEELESRGIPEGDPQRQLLLRLVRTYQLAHDTSRSTQIHPRQSTKPALSTKKAQILRAQLSSFARLVHGAVVPGSTISLLKQHALVSDSDSIFKASISGSGVVSKERLISEKAHSRADKLQSLLETLPKDSELYVQAELELKQLKLLDLQRRLRQEVRNEMSCMFWLQSSADMAVVFKHTMSHPLVPESAGVCDKVEHGRRMQEKYIVSGKQHQDWLTAVLFHARAFHDFHERVQLAKKKLFRRISKWHNDRERREVAAKEKLERDRLAALKRNDEKAYLELLEKTKNKRLLHLIQQTDLYLEQLGEKVLESQRAANARLGEMLASDNSEISKQAFREYAHDAGTDDQEERGTAVQSANSVYSQIHRVHEVIHSQPSILVGGSLKEYQMDGLTWLVSLFNNRLNGILADEMGLGKTIQTIALICYLYEVKRLNGPYLIVVPLSTISNWALEFQKWSPVLFSNLVVYKGTAIARKRIWQTQLSPNAGKPFSVVLTTFDYVIKDRLQLAKLKWAYVIVDEGHRMKNHNCKLSTTLSHHYDAQFRLILTGTPLQNSLPELWSLLNFLLPSIFNSVENFEKWFNKPFANTGEEVKMNEEESLLVIQRLHKVLRPFLLRRLKTQVEAQLPEKIERVIKVEMSMWQKRLYQQAKDGLVAVQSTDGSVSSKAVSSSIMQLRKICNHPYLVNDLDEVEYDDMLWRSSGKFELLDRILPKMKACGHRVLMFSQFTSTLNMLEIYFKYRDITFLRLDGSTKADDRGELLAQFNAPNSPYFMFILSTRAGGLGLNLQTADTVILFDSDWNPQADLQAQDRAHRIGQKNDVLVLRLVTQHSIEERILEAANYKLDLDSKIIQAGMFNKNSTAADRREFLMQLLKENVDDDGELDVPDHKQVNALVSRSDREYKIFQQMDRDAVEQMKRAWIEAGNTGNPPPPLVQEDELPAYLKVDLMELRERQGVVYGRGMRLHGENKVELTDEQFMALIDEEEAGNDEYDRDHFMDEMRMDVDRPNSSEANAESNDTAWRCDEQEGGAGSGAGAGEEDPHVVADTMASDPKTSSTSKKMTVIELPNRKGSGMEDKESVSNTKKRRAALISISTPLSALRADMLEILKKVTELKNPRGYKFALPFMDLPTEEVAPNYYSIIRSPMAFNLIKDRINHYNSLQQFYIDMMQVFTNAYIYNAAGSQICKDADLLRDTFEAAYQQSLADREQHIEYEAQLKGGPLKPSSLVEETGPTSSAAQPTSGEPKQRLKITFGKKAVPDSSSSFEEIPQTTRPAAGSRVIVSKPIVLKVPTEIVYSSEDENEDDGFADSDLRGTGISFEDKNNVVGTEQDAADADE